MMHRITPVPTNLPRVRLMAPLLCIFLLFLCCGSGRSADFQSRTNTGTPRKSFHDRLSAFCEERQEGNSPLLTMPSRQSKAGVPGTNTFSPGMNQQPRPEGTDPASATPVRINHTGGVYEGWVRQYVSQMMPAIDIPNAMGIDRQGNICITGTSSTLYTSNDFLTIKYAPSGDSLWARRYNGSGNGIDEATAISVDQDGNVYVAGYSRGVTTGIDIVLIKYSSGGDEIWVRRYDRPDHGDEVPTAMTITPSGLICCAGYSVSSSANYDCLILCYDSAGALRWTDTFDGPDHGTDLPFGICASPRGSVTIVGFSAVLRGTFDYLAITDSSDGSRMWSDQFHLPDDSTGGATAVASDLSDNVYVTGFRYSAGTRADFVTLKYDRAGYREWSATYNGPANSNDQARAIACDPSGAVVVTGSSAGKGTMNDFTTIKYDSSGNELWAERFDDLNHGSDDPAAIALDSKGDVYVTGSSMLSSLTSSDFATIKYSSNGTFLWMKQYNGPGQDSDIPVAIGIDSREHVFIAGSSIGADGSNDFAVVRYDQYPARMDIRQIPVSLTAGGVDAYSNLILAGVENRRWTVLSYDNSGTLRWKRIVGTEGSVPEALAVNPDGSCCVAGSMMAEDGTPFFSTVRIGRDGALQWSVSEKGVMEGKPVAIVSGRNGDLCIAGTGPGIGGSDILTVKYSASGNKIWSARYDGPSHGPDSCTSVFTGAEGRVIVVGSVTAYGLTRIVTLVYDSTGMPEHETSSGGGSSGDGSPSAAFLDPAGNLTVTGTTGTGSSSDILTLRISPDGAERWKTSYDGSAADADHGSALLVNPDGSTIVAGLTRTVSGPAWVTIRYDSNGSQQWSALRNTGDQGTGYPVGVARDDVGNIYVAGSDLSIRKYSPEGLLLRTDDGPASDPTSNHLFIQDPHGVLYITGNVTDGITRAGSIVCQRPFETGDANGWPQRLSGERISLDFASAVATDPSGDIYVTGTSINPVYSADYTLLKYSPAGSLIWKMSYNDAFNNYDDAATMVIDRDGNIDVTGTTSSLFSASSLSTVKFSSFGIQQWANSYSNLGASYITANAMALDRRSDMCIVGYLYTGTAYNYLAIHYSSAGEFQWENRYSAQTGGLDIATAVATDQNNNVYVTGYSYGVGSSSDIATVSYDRSGNFRWVQRYNGPINGDDRGIVVTVDPDNEVIVGGWSAGPDSTYDFVTLSYDTNGVMNWLTRSSGGDRSTDRMTAMVVDPAGSIVATGWTTPRNGTHADYFTLKYDRSGKERWRAYYNGPADGDDIPKAVALDRSENVYITGKSAGDDQTDDFATVCYDTAGRENWSARYSLVQRSDDEPAGIIADTEGSVYVTGTSQGEGWSIISTIKYLSSGVSGVKGNGRPSSWELMQPQPNPFNPSTTLVYRCAASSHITIRIWDLLGQAIATLTDSDHVPGEYQVSWNAGSLASGIYIARLEAFTDGKSSPPFTSTRKLLLLR